MKKRVISIFAAIVVLIPILLSCSDTVFDNPHDQKGDNYDPLAGVSIKISAEPLSQAVTEGQSVMFSCAATAGNFTPSYLWQISLTGTDTWTNLEETKADLTLSDIPLSSNGNRYRCIVHYATLTDTSKVVTLTVNKLIIPAKIITKLPAAKDLTAGDPLELSITAEGTDITYSWEQLLPAEGSQWNLIAGAVTNSYSLPGSAVTTALHGVEYRCTVKNSLKTETSTVTVSVVEKAVPANITTDIPAAKSISAEEALTLTIEAEGTSLTYRWEQLTVGSTVWEDAGNSTATFSLAALSVTEQISGTKYRCIVSNSLKSVTSTVLTLTVTPKKMAPTITEQPVDPNVFAGTEAVFKIKASSEETITYRWEKDGVVVGDNSPTLSFVTTIADNGAKIVCILTNSKGSTTSDTVTLTVTEPGEDPFVKTQPRDDTLWTGKTVNLTLVAENAESLQWEKWNGTAWIDIAGATAATLTLSGDITAYSEDKYRCRLIGVQNSTHSNEVTVYSIVRVTISTEPENLAVYEGAQVDLSFNTNGNKFNWQKKEGANFADLGITTAKHSFKATKALNGSIYRCKVSNDHGGKAVTREITLTVNPLPVPVVAQSSSSENSVSFTWAALPNTEGVHIYRSLSSSGPFEQITTEPVTVTEYSDNNLTPETEYYYQLKSTLGGEFSESSLTLFLTTSVDPTPVVVSQPENSEITYGSEAKVGIVSKNASSREWFEKKAGAADWTAIANSNNDTLLYSGENVADDYTVSLKCEITGPTGEKVSSQEAVITIKSALPKVSASSQGTSVKVGGSLTLYGTVSNEKSYRWQFKAADASDWIDVVNGAVKDYTLTPDTKLAATTVLHYRFIGVGINGDLVASETLVITVSPLDIPKIEALTGPAQVLAGNTATLGITSSNGTGFSWEWYNETISVWAKCDWPGAVNGNSSFNYITEAGDGGKSRQFRCIVSNDDGETISNIKKVSVLAPLAFSQQPKNDTASVDEKAKFTVQANGTGYLWQEKKGEEWINLSHIGSSMELTVDGSVVYDGAIYRCLTLYDGVDSLASEPCTLTIVNELDWMPSNVDMIASGSGIDGTGKTFQFAEDQFLNTADLITFEYTTKNSLTTLRFSISRKDGKTSNPNKKVKAIRVKYRVSVSESWANIYCRVNDNAGTVDIPREDAHLSELVVNSTFLTKELNISGKSGTYGTSVQGFSGVVEEVTFVLLDYGPVYPKGTHIKVEIADLDLIYEDL